MDAQLLSTAKSLRHYALGVAAVAGAAAIRTLIDLAGGSIEAPYLLYALPPMIAGWHGGFAPALVATFVGAVAVLAPSPFDTPGDARNVTAISLVLYLLQGVFISVLCGAKRSATNTVKRVRSDLEDRVEQRTQDQRIAYEALEGQYDEKRRLLEELNAFAAQLERSNLELQDFASVASHDLQEPLRKIQAFGDRLRTHSGPALDERGTDYLNRIQSSASRMTVLINDLLSFSRVSTQARPFEAVALSQTLADVLSDLETRIEELDATVTVGPLPTIDADPTQMRQLFQNLISNALKFRRPDTPPVVTITSRPHFPDVQRTDEWAEIQVADNGIGFDEKYLDRIFNIFQRLHARSQYEGTGIGLAVCRKIVERHGGRLTAESREGDGATFIVLLPLTHKGMSLGHESKSDSDHHIAGR